jgi:chitinase
MPLTIYVQLDVDYEYPSNDAQARGYVELLRELRYALDAHAARKGTSYRFLLTVRTTFPWTLCQTLQALADASPWERLQIAAPCGPQNYEKLHVKAMDDVLDFWNMMAYDFGERALCCLLSRRAGLTWARAAGSWDKVAGHQANVYGGDISADRAIKWYIHHGVHPSKVIMGIPLYGTFALSLKSPQAVLTRSQAARS